MSVSQVTGLIMAGCALFGVFLHAVIYAYREGRREQRLIVVEERVKSVPAMEVLLAAVTTKIDGLTASMSLLQSDLKTDVGEINHIIRNHLMKPRGGAGRSLD